jgi:hypothetical protein
MALFSRRKKSDSQPDVEPEAPVDTAADEAQPDTPAAPVPSVGISVQAFRGVGAEAGPALQLPPETPAVAEAGAADTEAPVQVPGTATGAGAPLGMGGVNLPLAPAMPPEQTHTVEGLIDNVLLREALAQVEEGATNEQLLGVMRQSLQGHLYLRVHGDAREQMASDEPLSISIIRDEDQSFMLAYSSGAALRASVTSEEDAASTSAIAQPVTAIDQQVVDGGFTGIIIDNSSGPHRVVFPTELLQRALEQGDAATRVKALLAGPRDEETPVKIAEALAKTRTWVAINDGTNGQPVGIAEAHTTDGRRFLQIFSHPLEVVVLGRKDQPMPFEPEQLAKVLTDHSEIAGILVDIAGPSIAIEREDLSAVMVLAVDLGDDD